MGEREKGTFFRKSLSLPPHFLLPQYGGMREGVACGEGASLKLADSPIFLDERREKQRIDECGSGRPSSRMQAESTFTSMISPMNWV